MSAATTYAPDRIGYRYGTPDRAYSKGYHRGQDVRKLNEAGTASVVTDVEAVDDGVVVYVGRPNGLLAWTVVIDTGRARGRYESHSHMADISVGVGQRVSSGDRLGRNASMREDHGFIDGVHDHVTITDRFDGAWVTWRDEYDPLPFMEAAYQRAREGANDMDASDKAIAAQTATDVSVIKQLLTETQQWKGIGQLVSETYTMVEVIKQLITETEQWKGIGFLVSETYQTVTKLAAAISAIAEHDAGGVDPAIIAELRSAVDKLATVNFPTEATITDAVAAAAQKARIDELEAELARLRETAGATA